MRARSTAVCLQILRTPWPAKPSSAAVPPLAPAAFLSRGQRGWRASVVCWASWHGEDSAFTPSRRVFTQHHDNAAPLSAIIRCFGRPSTKLRSLPEIPFCLRRLQLPDADPIVAILFDDGLLVPLARGAGVFKTDALMPRISGERFAQGQPSIVKACIAGLRNPPRSRRHSR